MSTHPIPAPNISQPRSHHRQIPNNVPNPPPQQTPTPPSKLNTLSSQILKRTSHAWKSFQQRSLANDQRYHLDTFLSTKNKRSSAEPITAPLPYPETDPIASPMIRQASARGYLSWHTPEPVPIPSTASALSDAARVVPYQPGHPSAIQSPYYLLVCLPMANIVQDPTHRRPSPSPSTHRVILCSPYRPYRTTIPISSSSRGTASGELWMDFTARGEQSRPSSIHLFPFLY
ncbi:hypothetical protein J3F84DRAFT_373481 [Trichoderma pleuroticola]